MHPPPTDVVTFIGAVLLSCSSISSFILSRASRNESRSFGSAEVRVNEEGKVENLMKSRSRQITFGQQLRKFSVGGFVLTETLHQPSLTLPRHDHECANLNLTISGHFRELIGSRPQDCRPASLLVKPAGEFHANQYGNSGAHCLIIEVTAERLESLRNYTSLFDSPVHIAHGTPSTLALRVYRELCALDGASPVLIEGLLLEIFGEASRRASRESSATAAPLWLIRARELLHEQFSELLTLSAVAELVNVHPAHLARMFRRHYHTTVGDYL
jgi:AraC family transcriptional regulator